MHNTSFESELAQKGRLVYKVRGRSMEPMLRQNRDLVHISKISGPLKQGDVALYRRATGQYVLHRVVGRDHRGYIFLGDNESVKEYGIREDAVLGVLAAFVRKGKTYSVEDCRYQRYVRLWQGSYPVRAVWRKLLRRLLRLHRRKEAL